jgi:hypothetical protein
MCTTCSIHLITLDLITLIIFGEAYKLLGSFIMQSSPASRPLIPLRSKYSPQHPVLKHPQSILVT